MLRITATLVALLLLTGCATVASRSVGTYQKNSFYAGTQLDWQTMHDCLYCWFDLPLSVVGDTLMLPFDTWRYYQVPELPDKHKPVMETEKG